MLLLYLTVLTTRLLLPPDRPVQGDCAADVCQSSEPKICIGFPLGKATRGLNPQILCVTRHHLRLDEIKSIYLGQYILGTYFCRSIYKQGGVPIFVSKNIRFQEIDLNRYVKEKDFEICTLKLQIASINFIIICLYRSPTGNYIYFLNQLESVLNKLYRVSTNIILCGDFNINFIETTSRITLLESLTASFSLFGTIKVSH